jgi:hypothetical protein
MTGLNELRILSPMLESFPIISEDICCYQLNIDYRFVRFNVFYCSLINTITHVCVNIL